MLWTLLMITTLFNSTQTSTTLYSKDPITAGKYKVAVHANSPIVKATSDYWSCNVAGQDAVCNINVPWGKSNLFLTTFKLQKRADNHYIVDFSNTDSTIRPNPSIFNNKQVYTWATNTKATTTVTNKTMATKKTWLSLTLIMILMLMLISTYGLLNIRKN